MEQNSSDLYRRLMIAHQEAFAGQLYETAYHALAAVMHLAYTLGEVHLLEEIEQLVHEEIIFLHSHQETKALSMWAVNTQKLEVFYHSLAKQAASLRINLVLKQN